jgi:predicted enzyme related to lactoylglutathione lyase
MVKHGDWYWHELMVPDPTGDLAFYKAVLGWGENPMQGMENYTLVMQGETPTAGAMPAQQGQPPAWLAYVAVRDINAAKASVEANKGKVWVGPTATEGVGTWMVCADPQGAPFALIQPASGTED